MRLRSGLIATAVAAVVALGSLGAEGSPIIFTDRAAFVAVTQPNVLVTFDKVADAGSNFGAASWSYVVDDSLHISFLEEGGFLVVRDPSGQLIFDATGHAGTPQVGGASPGFGALDMVGGSSIRAIGFDVSTTMPPQGLMVEFGNETEFFLFTSPAFIGLLFSTPPKSVGLGNFNSGSSFDVVIDNIVIRTPEPATRLLLGSGFMVLQGRSFLGRRRSLVQHKG